eukprot:jgi/Galph1/5064/GphlegSOOS_G3703.1
MGFQRVSKSSCFIGWKKRIDLTYIISLSVCPVKSAFCKSHNRATCLQQVFTLRWRVGFRPIYVSPNTQLPLQWTCTVQSIGVRNTSDARTEDKEVLEQTEAWNVSLFQMLAQEATLKREIQWLYNFAAVYELSLRKHPLKRHCATTEQLPLMEWLSKQRYYMRQGTLSSEKQELLKYLQQSPTLRRGRKAEHIKQHKMSYLRDNFSVGFVWRNVTDEEILERLDETKIRCRYRLWCEKFIKLVEFKKEHGHVDLDRNNCSDKVLLSWLRRQHRAIREEKLDLDRLVLLAMLGYEPAVIIMERKQEYENAIIQPNGVSSLSFEKRNSINVTEKEAYGWCIRFIQLVEFWKLFGHTQVNEKNCGNCSELVEWTMEQRVALLKGDILTPQAKLLYAIGLQVKDMDGNIRAFPVHLLTFQENDSISLSMRNSYCWQPIESLKSIEEIQQWIRKPSKLMTLVASRDKNEQRWFMMFRKLVVYGLKFGDFDVSKTRNKSLALIKWIQNQRVAYQQSALNENRRVALEMIHFEFFPSQTQNWERMFRRLKAFQKQFGHIQVPRSPKYRELYDWCIRQKNLYRNGKLERNRYSRLTRLGMMWDHRMDRWNRKFMQLVEYGRKYGHLNVEKGTKDNPYRSLYSWIIKQRFLYRYGLLDEEKVRKLEDIHFDFKESQNEWKHRIRELEAYKAFYGNCDVAEDYQLNPGLARWVQNIREEWKKGKMNIPKYRELQRLGFRFVK